MLCGYASCIRVRSFGSYIWILVRLDTIDGSFQGVLKNMTVSVTKRLSRSSYDEWSVAANFGRIGPNGQYRFGHVTKMSIHFDDENRRFRHKYMRSLESRVIIPTSTSTCNTHRRDVSLL